MVCCVMSCGAFFQLSHRKGSALQSLHEQRGSWGRSDLGVERRICLVTMFRVAYIHDSRTLYTQASSTSIAFSNSAQYHPTSTTRLPCLVPMSH
jgi:hypothetical protein